MRTFYLTLGVTVANPSTANGQVSLPGQAELPNKVQATSAMEWS